MMDGVPCDNLCSSSPVVNVDETYLQHEDNPSVLDVEIRCSLPVSLQTDVINGLLFMDIDPQPMIEEAIRLSVEEKLGVLLSGTDAPIQWKEHVPKDSEKKGENEKKNTSTTSSRSWRGSAAERKAIVKLGVDQLGTPTHLLRDCLLSHLLDDIRQLHHLFHSIPSVEDSLEKSEHNSRAEPKSMEKEREWTLCDNAAPHAELHVLHEAKKTVDKMLQRFAHHDDEQRKLIPTPTTTFPSSFQSFDATLKKRSAEEEKKGLVCDGTNSTIGEEAGEKNSGKIGKDHNLNVEEEVKDRELLLPVVHSVSSEALLEGSSSQEQQKCLETEQTYASIYRSPLQESMSWNSGSYNAESKTGNAATDHPHVEMREWSGNLSDAEYRAMGYMPL